MYDGRRRIRCEIGWLTVMTGEDVEFFKCLNKPRVSFARGGTQYWVSTASADGKPLLQHKDEAAQAAAASSSAGKAGIGGSSKQASGTKGERVAAHIREKEEHTSEEGIAVVNQALAEPDM